MKKIFAVIVAALLTLTCFGAGEYATANDLFQEWAMSGYPDYICGVWSNDGTMNNLTFAVLDSEEGEAGKAEILEKLEDDGTVTFVYQQYSRNYLTHVQDELLEYFERHLGLVSSGVDEMNNRINLGILKEKAEDTETVAMVNEIVEKYGDIFNVEYCSEISNLVSDLPAVDLHLQYDIGGTLDTTGNTSGAKAFLPFATVCILLVATVFVLLAVRKRALVRATNAGDIADATPSVKEVESMIKDVSLTVPETLDERIMEEIGK